MAGRITDYFGFAVEDCSADAAKASQQSWCPFLHDTCTKTMNLDGRKIISGVCAVKQKSVDSPEVICCPHRLYADNYKMLSDIATIAFGAELPLASGRQAVNLAKKSGLPAISVFGHRWGGELRLPKQDGRSNYFVDWVLAKISPEGVLEDFCAIEVQTIDTTGNYRDSRRALVPPKREIAWSPLGLNWENVNKRILPQIIYKAQVLSREELCRSGMFFVVPTPVYNTIMSRLGGESSVQTVGRLQPSSISFIAYDYKTPARENNGKPREIEIKKKHLTMVSEVRDAFNRAQLPEENVYGNAICKALDISFVSSGGLGSV
ncbi:NotI family restriction endonuclease [Dermabacteraceae bacterium P13095]